MACFNVPTCRDRKQESTSVLLRANILHWQSQWVLEKHAMKATVKLLLPSAQISFFAYIKYSIVMTGSTVFPRIAAQAKIETVDKESTNESQNVVRSSDRLGRVFVCRMF
jgi:hypothetical protein